MTVVLLTRHGESDWNRRQLVTGWSDPPLTDEGLRQARRAGDAVAAGRVVADRVYTSMLTRSVTTASIMVATAGLRSVPVAADWRLNERQLGRLEGLTKAEVIATWGNEWRRRWRDDDLALPPPLEPDDPRHPRHDPRYRHVPASQLAGAERGRDLTARVLDFWHDRVVPDLVARRNVLVVSHLGPLRVLARHLRCPAAGDTPAAPWPNGRPVVCRVAARPCCAPTAGPAEGRP